MVSPAATGCDYHVITSITWLITGKGTATKFSLSCCFRTTSCKSQLLLQSSKAHLAMSKLCTWREINNNPDYWLPNVSAIVWMRFLCSLGEQRDQLEGKAGGRTMLSLTASGERKAPFTALHMSKCGASCPRTQTWVRTCFPCPPNLGLQIKNDNKRNLKIPLVPGCCTAHQNRTCAFIGLCVSACAWMRLLRTAGSEECTCAQTLVSVFVYVGVMLARAVNTFKQFITRAVGKPFADQRMGPLIRIKSLGEPAVETQLLSDTHWHTKAPTHLFIPSRWSELMKPASCCSQSQNGNCFAWFLP